jgi:replicative DNA helicase
LQSELSIIKSFLTYDEWSKHQLSAEVFPEDLKPLYRTLDAWHKTHSGEDLGLLDLAALFFSQNKNNKDFYEGVFDTLETYTPNTTAVRELVVSLKRAKVLRDLSISSYEVAEGKKPYDEVQKLLHALVDEGQQEEVQEELFVSDDLESLLDATYRTPGLRWRLNALNESIGSLRKGDFGFIFARPETGKTTFLASEVSFMAEQVDGPILWLNNEEVNEKVKSRVYQAALGLELDELLSNPKKWDMLYKERFGGKILIPRQTSYSKWDIEKLCRKVKPSLIVMDQIDKVTGFKADREDLELGAIYQWFREIAKQYCPVIAVCQADGSGENKRWLTMGNVANAKTSKQAEADFIIGIGHIHDTGWEDFRFLNISKNKLPGDPGVDKKQRHGKLTCKIKPEVARYEDV